MVEEATVTVEETTPVDGKSAEAKPAEAAPEAKAPDATAPSARSAPEEKSSSWVSPAAVGTVAVAALLGVGAFVGVTEALVAGAIGYGAYRMWKRRAKKRAEVAANSAT